MNIEIRRRENKDEQAAPFFMQSEFAKKTLTPYSKIYKNGKRLLEIFKHNKLKTSSNTPSDQSGKMVNI